MGCRAITLRTDGAVALVAVVRTELGTACGGRNAGLELEERGVVPKYVHDLTRRDLLCGGPDMMAAAAKLLLGLPWRQLDVELLGGQGLRVRLRNAGRLDT